MTLQGRYIRRDERKVRTMCHFQIGAKEKRWMKNGLRVEIAENSTDLTDALNLSEDGTCRAKSLNGIDGQNGRED